jgi:c(7)-type cytochrome triheme protein
MRHLVSSIFALVMLAGLGVFAQPKAPEKLTFNTKMGNVTFNHAAHLMRAGGDCSKCHPSVFQQDKTAPLNFKANIHKTAETNKTSCGTCHNPSGPAFETKGNCNKCHVK